MDYAKTREEAEARKKELTLRLLAIPTEKKQLDDEADRAKRELIGLDQILDGVEFMTSDIPPDFEPSGFTDKIRKILSETSIPLVPTQIRDALEATGHLGSSSRNLLISVHTILERIKDELEESVTPEGKSAYRRKTPWGTQGLDRLRYLSEMLNKPTDPANLPEGIAGVIQGGTVTDAPENQPPVTLVRPKMSFKQRVEENRRRGEAARAKQEKKD